MNRTAPTADACVVGCVRSLTTGMALAHVLGGLTAGARRVTVA